MASTPFRSGAGDPLIARSSSIPRDEPQEVPDSFVAASGDFFSPDDLQQYISTLGTEPFKNFWENPSAIVPTGPFEDSTSGSLFDEDFDSGAASPKAPAAAADTASLNANGHLDLMAAFRTAEASASPFTLAGQSSTFLGAPDGSDMFAFGSGDETVTNQPFVFSLPDPSAISLAFQNYGQANMGVARPEELVQQVISPPDMTSPRGQKRAAASESSVSVNQTAEPSPATTPSFESPQWGQVEQPQQGLSQNTAFISQMATLGLPPFTYRGEYGVNIQQSALKSRVETQMMVTITMSHLPFGVTKLHLPPHTISKPKHRLRPPPTPSPDTLELFVSLVCTTPMENPELRRKALQKAAEVDHRYLPSPQEVEHETQNGCQVRICPKCMERERKRANRKKEHERSDQEELWYMDESHRIIIFNTFEMSDWRPPTAQKEKGSDKPPQAELFRQCPTARQVVVPMRLACYCRHQKEKTGFRVIFTFKDWKNNVVAQAMSGSIMITDDHKTTSPSAADDAPELEPQGPAKRRKASAASSSGSSSAPNTMSGSPSSSAEPQVLTTNHQAPQTSLPFQSGPAQLTPTVSPVFSPNMNGFQQPQGHMGAMTPHVPVASGPPPALNGVAHGIQNWFTPTPRRPESREDSAMLYSTPVSPHSGGSVSPTRGGLQNGGSLVPHNQMAQANNFAMGLAATPPSPPEAKSSPPIIHKVVPPQGDLSGGTEVTVLGANFFQGLEVWFGDNKATTTTFWSEASLVCLVPPSTVGGPVPLTLRLLPGAQPPRGMQAPSHMGRQQTTYTYKFNGENESPARSPYSFLNVNLASLPIFNAYIPQPAPLMRKVQEMMSASPGKAADNSSDNDSKADSRWWDLSSYMNSAVAPPAYNDIYPAKDAQVEDLDAKSVLSVARAAAEVEADMKKRRVRDDEQESSFAQGVVVYEEHETVTAAKAGESSSSAVIQPPAILEIGRKHAITKEQQENFLRAREQKLKKLSNDRNLFFIWIPLLLVMVCALLYSYFPSLFPFIFASIRALIHVLLRMLD
ncbi:hypothetical protein BBK36DRAFT_1143560 [Trichoderma citrinoviride]|uniref:IPT/TIG domain-containing protein n=1 Tax=Trichoderma citrinoviride TaxID=58853 RepID=A0A2T4B3E2_9HYPO|nr:hypothetical protein BBK36DRAFT_1143560 [Trichoderma citrinoviride]PTB63853.1 hypothetical protein BBK36DRAFT_1143560 [Trichoderma citrinoviride]